MREIKFRAWHMLDNRMFKVSQLDFQEKMIDVYEQLSPMPFHNIKLMQYTGLKDKNGKEIYEGDVVEEGGVVSVIKWAEPNARFFYKTVTGTVGLYGFYGEIIGNIYENSELTVDNKTK